MKAFVLGAGLGTRLQPLTEWLPKPLVPVYHRPLISHAFDHLHALGGITGFVVNTHHCPDAYDAAFPQNDYAGTPITFRHEPILLETAGGIANVADLLGNEHFLVYNGDILSDIPLATLVQAHTQADNEVTLLLRSHGPGLHIGLRQDTKRLADIRSMLGNTADAYYQFTGIYLIEPAFLKRLTPGKKESVIPIFLDMIREGAALGGCVEDGGHWWDLGDIDTYRQLHQDIPTSGFPSYAPGTLWHSHHPSAQISAHAHIDDASVIGPHASVADHATVTGSILWPGAAVSQGEAISHQVLRGSRETHFQHFFP